jgi:hypothetical protein
MGGLNDCDIPWLAFSEVSNLYGKIMIVPFGKRQELVFLMFYDEFA